MQCHSVQPLYGVTFDDPKKFFERFAFEAAQIHKALHFDKLKQTLKAADVEAVTEVLFEHVKSEPTSLGGVAIRGISESQ